MVNYWDGSSMKRILPGTAVNVRFGDNGEFTGSAGCNSYTGTYTADNSGTLTIGLLAKTGTTCGEPAGIMEQEDAYLATFQSAAAYVLEAGQLYIQNASGTVAIEYVQ
jgi:heat shock protein HslJ